MSTMYVQPPPSVVCLICGVENPPSSASCRSCTAPLSLAHAADPDAPPTLISIAGESNVGKTVYLGFLLDMLSQRTNQYEAIPRGAFSVDLQQNVISHMAHRMFPPKTPMESNEWYWAHYQVCKKARHPKWVDLVMPDVAGEALAAEVANPQTFKVLTNLMAKSAGVLLLVDAALAANGSSQPDFFGLKMLSYLDAMHGTGRDKKIRTPIAVVLCKADYCPEVFDDPRKFVQANCNRLWNMAQTRFTTLEYFACSVVGSLGYAMPDNEEYVIPIPLHTALRGVLEPFEWILAQL